MSSFILISTKFLLGLLVIVISNVCMPITFTNGCDRGPCHLNLILKQLRDRSSILLADFVLHTNNLFKKVSSQLLCFQLVSIAGGDASKDLHSEPRWRWPNTVALGGDFVSFGVDMLGDRALDFLLSLFVAFGL
jgi:hypothetical protein